MLEFEYVNRKSKVIEDVEVGDYLINDDDNACDFMLIRCAKGIMDLLNVQAGFTIFEEYKSEEHIIHYLNSKGYRKAKVKLVIQEE